MLGDPRRCAHLKSPTVAAIQRVHPRIPCLREPRVPSLRSIRPADRGPAVRCGSAGGGGRGECWARARARGVSGAPIWCVTHGAVPTWKARACSAYSGPITHLVWHHTLASRSLRRSGQRIADRRCAAASGGRGAMESAGLVAPARRTVRFERSDVRNRRSGGALRWRGEEGGWRALGSWLLTRLFRGAPPYGVRPTELCLPEKPNPVRHTAVPSRISCGTHGLIRRPVRSVRSGRRIADRRCAAVVRSGGWGEGAMESGQRGTFGSSGPSCETADRRCAAVRAAAGGGAARRMLGSCSHTRRFRLGCPYLAV
jgi:hypothetical protein